MGWTLRGALVIVAACGVLIGCDSPAAKRGEKPAAAPDAPPPKVPMKSKKVSDAERLEALSRATVWQRPDTPIDRSEERRVGKECRWRGARGRGRKKKRGWAE